MAGGVNGSANMLYYLYSGNTYWTMSPFNFDSWFITTNIAVDSTGQISRDWITNWHTIRPVINIEQVK